MHLSCIAWFAKLSRGQCDGAGARLERKAFLPYVGYFNETRQMSTLTITAKGQVTLRKDLLEHLGVRPGEKITVDTNVLVRAITGDDESQSKVAQLELAKADVVALALPALCELVWVLSQGYKVPSAEIAEAIRRLINSGNVVVNRHAVEAGLALLDAGGDFADGVIAHEGRWLGAETFVSFDKRAVEMLKEQGVAAKVL